MESHGQSIPHARARTLGLSSFALKIIAIVGMTACHVYYVFGTSLPFALQCILQAGGGLTFPIMAFLLVEGYRHTSSVAKYALRLFLFGLVTQIPYWLVLGWQGNIFFTLLVGLGSMALYDTARKERIPWIAFWAIFVLVVTISLLLDWGFIGPLMIIMMHVIKEPGRRIAAPLAVAVLGFGLPLLAPLLSGDFTVLPDALYIFVGVPAAGLLMSTYNGRRGKPLKWFFYCYYPAHIVVLGLLNLATSFFL